MRFESLEQRALLATLVWNGGVDANWSTPGNWKGGVAPQTGDNLVFPSATGAALTNNNDLPADTAFNTIEITGSGYTIGGNSIQLAGGLTANNVSGTNTFKPNITLLNAQSFVNANSGATLNIESKLNTGNLVGNYFFGTAPAIIFDGSGTINAKGIISGAGSVSKLGSGTAVLSGANTFEGIAEARQGVLRAANASALGSATTGHTEVQAGAALELDNALTAENIVIREGGVGFGSGANNGTDSSTLGALRAFAGTSSVNNVELIGGNNLIGAAAGATVVINGQVMSGINNTNRLIKVGPGTLQLAGTQDNVYRGETRVLGGTLELNKTAGKNAIGGDLIIGDNIGGDNAATVKLLQSNQIPQVNFFDVSLNTVTLNSSGVLDFNGKDDVIGNLILTTGSTYSADVATGAGTLTLGGNLTVNAFQGSSGATPAATISGKLDLGTFFSGGGSGTGDGARRNFNINDTQIANVASDLTISAVISGTADVSLNKIGNGTLRLTGANTMSGPFIMNGGIIEIGNNAAFGAGLVSLQNGANALRPVGASRSIGNPISLDGDVYFLGDDNTAGVENLTFTGAVTLTGGRTLFTEDPTQTVIISGAIGEGIFGSSVLNKSGRGTLAFEGANTYSGTTTLNNDGGTLILRGAGSALNVSSFTVGVGATLQIDNNSGANVADRINDATTINVNGGRLLFVGNSTANSSEFVGTVNPGTDVSSTLEVQNTSAGGNAFTASLVGNAMAVGTNRPTRFVGTGGPLSAAGSTRLSFTNSPGGLNNGIIQQGVIEGPGGALDFATYDSSPEGFAVVALPASAYVTDINQAGPTSNVRLSASAALATSKNVSALLLDPNVVLSGAGGTLTVSGGSVIQANGSNISVSNVNFGGGGLIYTPAGAIATIDGSIYNAGALRKDGPGKLILTGDNQYTGQTQVNDGVLNIQRSTALGSHAGDTVVRELGSLELEQTTFGPLVIGLENITFSGTGGATNVGGMRNIAGKNSLAGTLTVNGNTGATNDTLLKYGGWMGITTLNNGFGYLDVVGTSTFTLTGTWGAGQDLVKIGTGTLELAGFNQNPNRSSRIYQGTLLLNREPGLASSGSFSTTIVGSDVVGAPVATVKLATPDQLRDDANVNVLSTGILDLNGQSDRVAAVQLNIGPAGAGKVNIGTGATLTLNGDINVFAIGAGNAAGSQITGGTLALQVFGTIAGAGTRNFQVNDGAAGTDLTITSAIVDGTGLQSVGVNKLGFGTLEFGGSTANTYTGDTIVQEGTLLLNKGTGGSGNVNAFSGRLWIGSSDGNNQNVNSGFASSDIVRLLQPNQIPDFLSIVDIANTGLLDLNGNNETIGFTDAQNALTLRAGAVVELNGATLAINGNINTNAAQGVALWTPVVATRISDSSASKTGVLDLGTVTRVLDVPDRAELPWELQVSAKLKGTGGFAITNSGTILLDGDNSGLSGDILRTNGSFAVGSDNAFGAARVLMNGGSIATYNGPRTLANEFVFNGTVIGFLGGNNLAGTGAVGGGGNDLKITGLVNIAAGTWQPSVPFAGQVEFAGGIGETYGSVTARKIGYGVMIVSSVSTLSGLEIGQDGGGGPGLTRLNGGSVILRDNGSWLNASPLIGFGGTLELDNSGVNLANRLNDLSNIDIAGGTLAFIGKSGAAAAEVLGSLRLRNTAAANSVQLIQPSGANTANTLRFASLTQEAANIGNTIRFVGRGTDLSNASTNRVGFNTMPALVNGIISFGILDGSGGLDFASVANSSPNTTPADNFVTPLTAFATTFAGATSTTNVKLSAAEAIDAALTVNAVLLPTGLRNITGLGALTVGSGLLISSGNNTVSVPTLTLGGAEGILFADSGTLTVSSAIGGATSDLAKAGRGAAVISGANTFAGFTRITSGIFRATNSLAFGTTANPTTVTYGSTVEFSNNINVAAETIDVAGTGDANFGSVGLRNVDGNNTWNGNLTLQISGINRNALEIAGGSSLVVAGVVSGQGLSKTGAGTLQLAGTTANSFGGGGLLIWQGTVELNKTGVNAVATNTTVGDNVGAANSEKLVLLQSNQIADGNSVTVSSTGKLDLGDFTDTIASFSLQTGLSASGTISTNAAGQLTINGNSSIDTIANSGGGGSAGSATIAGNLALQISGAAAGTRTITVNDSVAVEDVVVTASITDGDGSANLQNLTKAGSGRMVLKAANTYSGLTTISGGELVVADPLALGAPGTVAAGSGTIVNSSNNNLGANASLLLQGVSVANEGLRLDSINNNANNGTGFNAEGALRSLGGTSVWTGDVTINTDNSNNFANVTIKVDAGQLTLSGAIGQQNQTTVGLGIIKIGEGTLEFGGTTANTYTGTTLVSQGTLNLNKTGVNAIGGVLTVGNDNGPQDADVVRLLQPNQIPDTVQVQVVPSGLLDLNGNNEAIGNAAANGLNLFLGVTTFPRITTGAGTLILNSGLGVTTQTAGGVSVTVTSSPGATIAGNLALGGNTVFTVNDSGLGIRELQVDATMTGTAGFQRSGGGIMVVTAANAGLSGGITLNSGGGIVVTNNGLGTGTITIPTNITTSIFATNYAAGAPVTQTISNAIALNNSTATATTLALRGDDNLVLSGTITNTQNNNNITANMQASASATLSGTVNLSNDATNRTLTINNNTFGGGVNNVITGGDVIVSALVADGGGSAASALTKGGVGLATLTNNSNTFHGMTTVNGGNLRITSNGALGSSIAEQQTFTVTSSGGGTFTIAFGNNNALSTVAIPYTGTTPPLASDVASALNNLLTIGGFGGVASVTSSNPAGPSTTYTVTFGGNLSGIDVPNMTVTGASGVTVSTAAAQTVQGTGGTVVNNGFTLQVDPGLNITETLTTNGVGFGNFGSIRLRDVTPGTTETTTISGYVNLNTTAAVGVDAGGVAPDRIITSGGVLSGNQPVKVGAGEWEVSGAADNFYNPNGAISSVGWDDGLDLRAGTVYLNKSGTARAIVGGGTIAIGDGGGGSNADRMILMGSSLDQIGGTSVVTIGGSGFLTLSDAAATEVFPAALNIQRFGSVAGTLDSTATRRFILGGTTTINNVGITTAATPAATIAGVIDLANGTRSFNVNDAYVLSPAEDLVINAQVVSISGGAGGILTKDGYGTLALTNGTNTYNGATNVNSATLDFNAAFNNGLNTVVGGTLVLRGNGVIGAGGLNVNSGATLVIDNTSGVANHIPDASSITMSGGTLRLLGNATADATEQFNALTLNAGGNTGTANVVSVERGAAGFVTQLLPASIGRGAGSVASFVGVGADLGATTDNRIQVAGGTSPFVNNVIPWATMTGPAGYDLVTDADGSAGAAPYFLGRVTTYSTDINAGGAVRLTGGTATLTDNRVVDALLIENGATIAGAFNLQIGTGGTPGLIASCGANNSIGAAQLDYTTGGNRELLFVTEGANQLAISSLLSGSGALRKEGSGNLRLTADNDPGFSGSVTINAGTVTITDGDALGNEAGAAGEVTVNRRAALIIDATAGNIDLGNTGVTVNGFGVNDDYSGSLRTIGNNTITIGTGATAFTLNTETPINVAGTGILSLNANVTGNQTLTKRGAGTLRFDGANANSSTGARNINEGTLVLGKTGAVQAINGTLTINDLGNFDPVGAATVLYAGNSTDQIGGVAITVNAGGTLDLATFTDSVGALTVQGGTVVADAASTGAFTITGLTMTGGNINLRGATLNLNGNLTYNSGLLGSGPATIDGKLDLQGGTRTFTVNDGYFVHNDLTINAAVSNGRIVKANAGALLLSNPANSFLGGINEVQTVTLGGTPTFGTTTFNLSFDGNTTGTINYQTDAATTAANIKAALEALPNIGPGAVNVTATSATVFSVEFTGHLGAADLPNNLGGALVTAGGATGPTFAQATAGLAGVRLNGGTLAFSDSGVFGTARVQIDGSSQLLPVGGDKTLTTGFTISPNITVTFGGRRDFGGTDDLTFTGGVTLIGPTSGQVVNLDVNDPQVLVTVSGVISSGGNQLVPTKRGIGTMIWSGNNTFDVRNFTSASTATGSDGIRLEGGILRITNSNSLGFTGETATVSVRADLGAVLQLDGSGGAINLTGRVLDIDGIENGIARGLLNRTSTGDFSSGILENLAGDNSITAAQLRLRHTGGANGNSMIVFFGVDAGSSLNIDAAIVGLQNDGTPTTATNKSVYLTGGGTLRYSGAGTNNITGTTAVFSGALELNKTPDTVVDGGLAVAGTLQIGDNVTTASVKWLQSEQFQINQAINVSSTGVMNLNGQSEQTSTTTTLTLGQTASSQLLIGAAGNWIHRGDVNVVARPGITTAIPITIAGNIQLTTGTAAQRVYTVVDVPGVDAELTITANVTEGTTAGGFNKAGPGRMVLNPATASTYTGAVTVSGGMLRITGDTALGTNAGGTTVNSGTSLELDGGATGFIETGESLSLNGAGIINAIVNPLFNSGHQSAIGTGALRNLTGKNEWQGNVALNSGANVPTSIGVDAGSLALSGASILSSAGSDRPLLKVGAGTLELGGTVANTYNSNTYINDGTLVLNKQGGVQAIIGGEVTIGDNVGADNSDVLRLSADNQIADRVIRIARSGLFDFNDHSDTISATITLDVGPTMSADISTGTGVFTNATANNQFTVVSQAGLSAASPAAVFKGIYDLSGATRNIEVREGLAPTEFDIQGVIQVAGAFGITKIGQGRLRLSGDNTYTGATTVSAGVLDVGSANALGTTAGATSVSNLAALEFNSAAPLTIAEDIYIAGDGWNGSGTGSLNNLSAGGVNLTGVLTLGSSAGAATSAFGTATIGNAASGSTLTLPSTVLWIGGTLVFTGSGNIVAPASLSNASINLSAATLYLATGLGVNNVTTGGGGINRMIPGGSLVPAASRQLVGALNFPQDADPAFTAFFGGLPGSTAFTTVFYGTLDIAVAGTYYFAASNNDDTAAVWIGPNSTFAAGDLLQSVGCCNSTAVVSKSLNPGRYFIAYVVEDTGGGSGLTARIQGGNIVPTNSTTMPIVTGGVQNLIKNGAGTLTLGGVNNYQQTVINGGAVLVNGSVADIAAAPDVVVNSGATLGGNGTVFGTVQVNAAGNVAPGPTPELLNTGSITWTPTSTYTVNIAGAAPGTGYDQLKVTGNVTLGNATLVAAQSFVPTPGQVLTIIVNDGADAVSGTFNNLPEGAAITIGGTIYHVTYKYDFDTSTLGAGNDVALVRNNDLTAVADTFNTNEDTSLSGNVKANDTDLDGDGAVQIVANTTKGTLTMNNATGAFTYAPNANFSGTDTFTYKLFDGEFTSSTVTVTINVAAVADTPTISVTNASGNEDTTIPLTISGALTDTDGSETLSFRITGVPTGAAFSAGTNQGSGVWTFTPAQITGLTFTPPLNASGSIPLSVSAVATETSNSSTASATAALTVTVVAVADTPSITTSPAFGAEDTPIALTFNGALADNDGSEVLTYRISNVPTGASLTAGTNAGGGVWNLTAAQAAGVALLPAPNDDADFVLTVAAIATETSNNSTAQASATLAVTVNAVADAPSLTVSPAFGVEDGGPIPLSITGSLTDTDGSETLSFRIDNVPSGGSLSAGTSQGGGTWLLTPAQLTGLNFIQPANGGGVYSLLVSAIATETSNNSSAFTSATLPITINAVADTPSITTSPASGNEDTPIPLTFNGVLADTDGSEVLSYRFSNVPTGATLSAGTNLGGGVWTVTLPQSFGLSITPAANSSGAFTLTVTAIATEQSNGSTAQASANLAVTVNAVADQPNLTVAPASGPEDTNIPLSISSSLVDTDGSEALSISISGVPTGASLSAGTNNGGGNWTLTPAQLAGLNFIPIPNVAANYTLTVTATATESSNASTAQRTASLPVTVTGVADTPTLTVQNASGLEDTFINLTISGALTDTDGSETLSFRIANVPAGATFNGGTNQGGGVWTFTAAEAATLAIKPPLNSDVDMALSVQAVSTEGLTTAMSAAQTLTVTVTAVADAVTLTVPGPLTGILENTAVALPIAASLFDTDGSETLTVAITNVPSDAQIIGGTNMGGGVWNVPLANLGSLQFKRDNNPIGSAPFTITVTATTTEADPAATPRTQVTTKNISLQVVDKKPTAQYLDALILGTSYGPVSTLTLIPGVGITFSVAATDLAGALDNPFSFEINWGDGPVVPTTVTNYVPGQPLALSHVYGTYGTFQPTLRVKDRDGVYSDTIQLATITAKRIVVQDGTLYVAGSNLGDRIVVQQAIGGVSVRINNEQQPLQQVSDRVIIFGNDGADTIQVSGNLLVPVEFYGGNGDDYLSGGNFGDLLDGGPGNDRLLGGGGDDTLLGGSGNDTAGGGNGNDYIAGDLMVDIIGGTRLPDGSISQPGDLIDSGFAGKDNLSGDAGDDTILGGAGADTLNGGAGQDFIRGGAGGDRLDGGDGNDFLFGENDSDVLYGRQGRDVLIGGLGTDQTYGGTSADLIFGGEIDPALADDLTLAAIWQAWSAGNSNDAMDQLMSIASDDVSRDSLNGEGDDDWYLMFILHKDTFATASEAKAPNQTFLM